MKRIRYDDIAVGKRIKKSRKRMGYTRQQLAKRIGIDEEYVIGLECGQRQLTLNDLILLSSAVGAEADYILFGKRKRLSNTPIRNLVEDMSPEKQYCAEKLLSVFVRNFKDDEPESSFYMSQQS